MKKYEVLTKYIPYIDEDDIGKRIIDRENDGTLEHPKHFPYVAYSQLVNRFIDDVHDFVSVHPEWALTHYQEIMRDSGIQWNSASMSGAITENLDGRCICALLVGAVRAERFCDGALMQFFRNGSISRWLRRLQELDSEEIG